MKAGDGDRSISVVGECVGPCISRRADVSVVYVEVQNTSAFDDTTPFYAYTEPWIDEAETANDTLAGAAQVSPTDGFRGAIERRGDHDYVWFPQDGTVAFDGRPDYNVNFELDLYEADGTFVGTYGPGDDFIVLANEYALIRSDPTAPRASVYGFYDVYNL